MLTIADEPTIRWAISKRLDKAPGVERAETIVRKKKDCIFVGILFHLDKKLIVKSTFELPHQFDVAHLHNEIDQLAEQLTAARRDHFGRSLRGQVLGSGIGAQLAGTGLRGLWSQHA